MSTKKKALRALGILAVVIALCIFFGQTVQTITTPKIQRVTGTRGKFEEKFELVGKVYFSDVEEVTAAKAEKMNVRLGTQYVRAGSYLKAGDVIFDAAVPEYEKKKTELQDKYDAKVREVMVLRAKNVRALSESEQNDAYNAMMKAGDTYYHALYNLHVIAKEEKYILPADETAWPQIADAPEKTQTAIQEVTAAYTSYDEAFRAFKRFYTHKDGKRVPDMTFDYIKELDEKRQAVADIEKEIMELDELYGELSAIRAPHDGYLAEVMIKKGESYDGTKPAFSMSKADSVPVIRIDITDLSKKISEGDKVSFSENNHSKIESIHLGENGKKFAHVTLSEENLSQLGGMNKLMAQEQVNVSLRYKAKDGTTLLPASVVRSDGENSSYVYVVQQNYGGLLGNSRYTVVKTPVTILEKSEKIVSIQEDMAYTEFADREDRALSDGQAVMDYVN